MGECAVRLWPDPVLTQTCERVSLSDADLPGLIADLFDTMYAAKGRGLAAPQIGVIKRVFVVDLTWKEGNGDPRVFINPKVVGTGERTTRLDEQCLSIPDLPMPVTRPDHINLRWTGRDGVSTSAGLSGMLARCILHEMDHLNGTVLFDHQTVQDRAKYLAAYAP